MDVTAITKIRRQPNYQVLAESIASQILDGRLAEGDVLPTEVKLCEMFGVNRSSVREGLRVLEESNLIKRESAKKLVVAKPSKQQLGEIWGRALILHQITFQELWEAMYTIEPVLASMAAQAPRDTALYQALQDNLEQTEAAAQNGHSLVALDIEFHDLVARLSGNRALELAREPLGRLFYPTFDAVFSSVPAAGARLIDAHRMIAQAIERNDKESAEEWMQKHIRDFKRGYVDIAKLDVNAAVSWKNLSVASKGS